MNGKSVELLALEKQAAELAGDDAARHIVQTAYELGQHELAMRLVSALSGALGPMIPGPTPPQTGVPHLFVSEYLDGLPLSDDVSEAEAEAAEQRARFCGPVTPFETGAPWHGPTEAEWDSTRD